MKQTNRDPLEPILTRTSCRAFRTDPLSEGDLGRMIEAMVRAPSAGNKQPWRFLIIHSQDLRSDLSKAAFGQDFLAQAPVVIVICADVERSAARYGERGRSLYALQDTAAATENLLIAATALGYGSCWVGAFDEDAVRSVLDLPLRLRPVAMVPVGKPAERNEPTERRPKRDVVETR